MKVYRYLSIASQTKAHLTGLTILTINLQQKYLRSIHPNAFPLGRIQRESVVWDWPVADVKTQVSGAAMVAILKISVPSFFLVNFLHQQLNDIWRKMGKYVIR